MKKAFRYVRGNIVAFLDADLDLHPEQIQPLFYALKENGADVVIGSKRHPRSRVKYPIYKSARRWLEGNEDSMSEVRFKGKEFTVPEVGILWIPTAKVELITNEKNYFCEMIVDSGADITLIPGSLGDFLELSFRGEKIREMRGIGEGAIPYIIKTIGIKIGRSEFQFRIGVALIEEVPFNFGPP